MGAGYGVVNGADSIYHDAPAYRRGDVVMANLGPGRGSEQGGYRPVVIISNNVGNVNGPTVIVAPITRQVKAPLPTHASLEAVPGLDVRSVALAEQIRTLDKDYIRRKVARLDNTAMWRVDQAVGISIGRGEVVL